MSLGRLGQRRAIDTQTTFVVERLSLEDAVEGSRSAPLPDIVGREESPDVVDLACVIRVVLKKRRK
jgi:hypothetical protein